MAHEDVPPLREDDSTVRPPVTGLRARILRNPYTMTYGLSEARTRIFCEPSEIAISGGFEGAPDGWTIITSTNSALPSEFIAANHWLFEVRGPMITTEHTVWFTAICLSVTTAVE